MSNLLIAVGTVYGSTIDLAEEAIEILTAMNHSAEMFMDFQSSQLNSDSILLIMTASTGMGDIPDNLMGFYCDLLDEKPDLKDQRFAIVGLGDSSYDYYNGAARRLNELFLELGAQPVAETLLVDANEHPDPADPIASWIASWA
jgi:MioC protein